MGTGDATAPGPGSVLVLGRGELHRGERFGPGTVCRGALLMGCEWDGGVVESGVLAGCLFRSGEFRGGTFFGGVFLGGRWAGGRWENGFDASGRYRPRGSPP